jgi:hypothetical protein
MLYELGITTSDKLEHPLKVDDRFIDAPTVVGNVIDCNDAHCANVLRKLVTEGIVVGKLILNKL